MIGDTVFSLLLETGPPFYLDIQATRRSDRLQGNRQYLQPWVSVQHGNRAQDLLLCTQALYQQSLSCRGRNVWFETIIIISSIMINVCRGNRQYLQPWLLVHHGNRTCDLPLCSQALYQQRLSCRHHHHKQHHDRRLQGNRQYLQPWALVQHGNRTCSLPLCSQALYQQRLYPAAIIIISSIISSIMIDVCRATGSTLNLEHWFSMGIEPAAFRSAVKRFPNRDYPAAIIIISSIMINVCKATGSTFNPEYRTPGIEPMTSCYAVKCSTDWATLPQLKEVTLLERFCL